jgi:hypothetical protein
MKGIRHGLNSGTTQHLPGETEEKVVTVVEVLAEIQIKHKHTHTHTRMQVKGFTTWANLLD